MRMAKQGGTKNVEIDMTPMIDMTFQLVAFFMVVLNFSDVDQSERVKLPPSELAKPPDAPLVTPITLQLMKGGTVITGFDEVTITGLRPFLVRERQLLEATPKTNYRDAVIVVRADRDAKTGEVQELIRICQEVGFEKFALRAKQERAPPSLTGS
jgi:biopolymer transport protein ExbD